MLKKNLVDKIKFILDGGKCLVGIESTIISLVGKPTILRLGGLDISKIEKVLGFKIKTNINPKKKLAPGQSRLHYSPDIPLKMNAKNAKIDQAFLLIKKRKKSLDNYYYLSKKNNLNEAAHNLYSCLRKIKKKGYKSIVVEKISKRGLR